MCGSRRLLRKIVTAPAPGGRGVRVEADVCSNCHEQFFGPSAMQRIQSLARRK